MISRIQNINFKGQQKSNEQNRFSISMTINSPKQDEIISDIVNSDIQENYPKSRMLEKFASIYEKSNKAKIANSLYRKAVDLKENSDAPIFEVFKSYIALQKTYQDLDDTKNAEIIEDILNKKINEVGTITKEEVSNDEILRENILFIKVALKVCQQLLNKNQPELATEIFNTIENEIQKNDIDSKKFGNFYKEIKAEILQKNNLFDESTSIYQELSKIQNGNEYSYKVVASKLSSTKDDNLENSLNNLFGASDSQENILKNLFYRTTYQLNKGNLEKVIKYMNLAYALSLVTESDIKPDLNILVAMTLQQNNQIDKSNEVCINTLEQLQKQDKSQSLQYIKTLTILAANNFIQYQQNPTENKDKLCAAKSMYSTAYKISNTMSDKYSQAMITADMAEITLMENNTEKAIYFAEKTLKNTEEDSFRAKAYGVLGKIAQKNLLINKALEYFENQRKHLINNNSPLPLIKENASNIIDIYKSLDEQDKVEEYTRILLEKGSVRFQDLMELGNSKIKTKEYKEAQEYFEQAAALEHEAESAKAIAKIHIGIAKLNTLNDKMALFDIENGCEELEQIVKKDGYSNPKETKNLIDTLNFVGDFYYFEKAKYKEAADIFSKIANIIQEQNSIKLSEEFVKKSKLKAGASLYKAKKYEDALPYYMNILREMTNRENLAIESLDGNFVKNIIETKNRKECTRVANALEILGVINTKLERFTSARICFETAKDIREDAGGNKLLLAKNYRALSRLDMINNFSSAKTKLEKAIELLKSDLGAKSPEVIKEEKFRNDYFGTNLTSASKYITRGFGKAKEYIGLKDNYKKEIIDDFHLIYEDLALCE